MVEAKRLKLKKTLNNWGHQEDEKLPRMPSQTQGNNVWNKLKDIIDELKLS